MLLHITSSSGILLAYEFRHKLDYSVGKLFNINQDEPIRMVLGDIKQTVLQLPSSTDQGGKKVGGAKKARFKYLEAHSSGQMSQ